MYNVIKNNESGHSLIGVLETMSDGFVFVDNHWKILYLNQSASKILSTPFNEVLEKDLWTVFPEAKNSIAFNECHRAKTENVSVEFKIFVDHTNNWLEIKAFPLPEGLVIYIRDITTKIQLVTDLKRQSKLFSSLMDKGADMMGIVDESGYYKFVSSNVKRIFGYSVADLVGKNAFDLIHPDDIVVVSSGLQKVVASNDEVEIREFRFKDAFGNWRWVEVIATNMLHDEIIRGIIINSREITEWKQKDEDLKKAFFSITLQNRKLKEIAFIQSHELRKPVANIIGLVQIIKGLEFSEENRKLLDLLNTSTTELDDMIKRVVSLTESINEILEATG